jgi:hypothetical protein
MFVSLKDKGSMAQVDETCARVFLKEGRYSEAEKVARASVRALEKNDMQLPLVESLTAHGTALARLGNYGAALTAFRRAIDGSQQIGCLNPCRTSRAHCLSGNWRAASSAGKGDARIRTIAHGRNTLT